MKTVEKVESLQEMKQMVQEAIDSVEDSRKKTEYSETSSYWMTVKMENDRQSFRLEDIQMAVTINHRLSELIDHYDKMLQLGKEIMQELDEVEIHTGQPKRNEMEAVEEEVKIISLYAKMYLLLREGEECMEVDRGIQTEADVLEKRLRGRASWERWHRNLKNKFKRVFL